MQQSLRHAYLFCVAAAALCLSGCTSFSDYVHHGFKVGPEYTGAKAAVAPGWIDSTDLRVRSDAANLSQWWCVFNDPMLNDLVYHAYNQNINLKEYGTRILQARAQLAIARGDLFPQQQQMTGSYTHTQTSGAAANSVGTSFSNVSLGFNLAWELDFWGLYRRQVLAAAPIWTPRSRTTTPCSSPCWPTRHSITSPCGRPRSGSKSPGKT